MRYVEEVMDKERRRHIEGGMGSREDMNGKRWEVERWEVERWEAER
mgnify:CR=1 FL=1